MKKHASSKKKNKQRIILASCLLAVFGGIGLLALRNSNAAVSVAAVEAESGTPVSGATKISSPGASGGQAVSFQGGGTNPPNPGGMPPITREGTKLMRAGKQWKFAGVNADKWFGCHGGSEIPSDSQLDQYFRELNPRSATRIWPYGGTRDFGMMDKIVSYAEKYNQYLVPALFDGNSNQCGTQPVNKGNPSGNVAHAKAFVARYSKTAPASANPTNSIAFWEASNEVCGADSVNWFQAMANGIKEADPTTLVGSGSMPRYCFGPEKDVPLAQANYEAAHAGKMDLISIHEYDAATGMSHWGAPAAQAAKALNKVWYAGEDGFCCGGGGTGSESGDANKLKAEWDDYLRGPESAGMLYWAFRLNNNGTDIILGRGAMWDVAKNYRHEFQGN